MNTNEIVKLAVGENGVAGDFLLDYLALSIQTKAFLPDKPDVEGLLTHCIAMNQVFSHPYYSAHLNRLSPLAMAGMDDQASVVDVILAVATIEGGYERRRQVRQALSPKLEQKTPLQYTD